MSLQRKRLTIFKPDGHRWTWIKNDERRASAGFLEKDLIHGDFSMATHVWGRVTRRPSHLALSVLDPIGGSDE